MAAFSGIWGGATVQPSSAATAAGSSTATTSSSATISANDFLTLLVTEMQNQDPTATTDPNEYINQLVNVNSLEQLININQTLTTAMGGSGSSNTSSSAKTSASAPGTAGANPPFSDVSVQHSTQSGVIDGSAPQIPSTERSPGNLSIPSSEPAAMRVAQSLNNR